MSLEAFLRRVVGILDAGGVPYMLTGSLAASFYAAPRATQDIDLVFHTSASGLDRIVDGFLESGLYVSREAAHAARHRESQFNVIEAESGWKADLISRKSRAFSRKEFRRRRTVRILTIDVSITTPEDLVLTKPEWSARGDSELQRQDLLQLLSATWASLDRPYVEHWVDGLELRDEWEALLDRAGLEGDRS